MTFSLYLGLLSFGHKVYLFNKKRPNTTNLFQVQNVSTSPLDRVHVEPSVDKSGLLLVFRSIEMVDEGTFICEDESGSFLTESPFRAQFCLFAVQPIDFGQTATHQSVQIGPDSHRLICPVRGHPSPVITWKAKGQTFRKNSGEKYELDGTDLIIRNINKNDEGSYLCKGVQTVLHQNLVQYSDFKDKVIQFKIERKY